MKTKNYQFNTPTSDTAFEAPGIICVYIAITNHINERLRLVQNVKKGNCI